MNTVYALHRGRLRAAAEFGVVLLGAEFVVYLTVACGLAYTARIEDQIVTQPPLGVIRCGTTELPALTAIDQGWAAEPGLDRSVDPASTVRTNEGPVR
jgi:hypothetical protein